MISKEPKDMQIPEIHKFLLSAVAPRPIAFVSTISKSGIVNLSPYSFFNAFGSNPPIVAFSSSRRGTNATTKDTYNNLIETEECVINAVTFAMVEQMNLASGEYPEDVNEFEVSGFTPVKSDLVKPPRVKESPFAIECKLHKMVSVGEGRGSANLAICEVIKFHYDEDVWEDGIVEPDKIDLVGRNGALFYTRASGEAIFEVPRPHSKKPIGWNGLPDYIKNSVIYSANNLGKFAGEEAVPTDKEVNDFIDSVEFEESSEEAFWRFEGVDDHEGMMRSALFLAKSEHHKSEILFEYTAKTAIENGDAKYAWLVAKSSTMLKK